MHLLMLDFSRLVPVSPVVLFAFAVELVLLFELL